MPARPMAYLSCLVALTACGGGGSGGGGEIRGDVDADAVQRPDEAAEDSPGGGVELSGRVLDAVTGIAIPGVEVRLTRSDADDDRGPGPEAATGVAPIATTLADGRYRVGNVPAADGYVVAFEVDGYKNELYTNITPDGSAGAMLDPVRLVSDDNAGAGQLAGVVGGTDGGPGAADLTLDFREGIDRRTGEAIATARTAADGSYRVDGIGYGNVTVQVSGEGIRTSYATFQVLGNILSTGQDITVSPADALDEREPADAGALRIVLTWDERPGDLDAHLTGPESAGQAYFHVFSGSRDAEAVRLVDDATLGAGPEAIEIDRREPGVYRYSVFNFSGDVDRPLERSGARVAVLSGDASIAEFAVPAGVGNLWTVFDIVDGQIVAVNTVARLRNVLDYFPPEGRELAFDAAVASGAIPPDADARR